jgi:dipeptidyl aminopeptidase/acylaminoacyl peptidase
MHTNDLQHLAWIGDALVAQPIRGVILVFHGLGGAGVDGEPTVEEIAWAKRGGLVVRPYCGPWTWMNRQTRAFVEQLLDAIYQRYELSDSMPLIAIGTSMGGQGALIFTRYARRKVVACVADMAVCDLQYHYDERADVARTIHCAFRGYDQPIDALFAEHSPIEQVEQMPDIAYLMIHGAQDEQVAKTHHSDRFVARMTQHGRTVEYIQVPNMGHGGPMPADVIDRRIAFVGLFLKGSPESPS